MRRLTTLLVWLLPLIGRAQAPFSIDDVLSAPYCSELTGLGSRAVWVVTTEGVRNIVSFDTATRQTRPLTQFTTDDGQELSDLRVSATGHYVAYVRGSGRNREGVSANPTSHPAGAEQAVYLVRTDTVAPPVRVAPGNQPRFSPDGRRLLFAQGGQLYLTTLPTTGAGAPTTRRLFTARGTQGAFSWSPEGNRVVFTSARGYHNFIGVFDLNTEQITWLAPGVDRDQLPVWSPDGRRVAFIRVPGQVHGELENVQGGHPFGVWVADVATGEGRQLWQSPADDGGFAQYYPAEPLRWTAPTAQHPTGRLLFFSEHTGWMHVFALAPDGSGPPVALTPGPYEAEETFVTPDGQWLYVSANKADHDPLDRNRRHIWRISLTERPPKNGAATAMTAGAGIETDPLVLGNWLLYRQATHNRPTGVVMQRLGTPALPPLRYPSQLPARFPTLRLPAPQAVTFRAADGLEIHGQLFLPPPAAGHQSGPLATAATRKPALIFLHGGPMRQMLLGWHYRGLYYANAYAMNQYLAAQGYVVLAVNFRTGIGYGRAFRRAERQGPRGASEYQDVLAAANYLQRRADVDARRMGLWGGSYGGYLTALGLARHSDRFACGVDLHGVHDWSWRGNMFSPGGGWGIGEAESKLAFASSPNAQLDGWRSPCLFVHGDDDRNVTFAETVDLVQKLRQRHVVTEVLVLPDEVHSFLLHRSWLRTYKAMDRFLARWLTPAGKP